MIEIIPKPEETRKNYLIRVAIAMLNDNAYKMGTIIYDEADCDAICLAEDLANEFGMEQGK